MDVLQQVLLPSLESFVEKLPLVRVNLAESLKTNTKLPENEWSRSRKPQDKNEEEGKGKKDQQSKTRYMV